MTRRKIPKQGAEVFKPDPNAERPPAFPIRVGGVVLKCRGDGAPLKGKFRDRTDEYGQARHP